MSRLGLHKKALQASAFFVALCFSNPLFALCPSHHYDETVTIAWVHDGDTVRLTDGRNIRLIGINSPELARDGRPAEPYAIKARDFLRQFATRSRHWHVRWGKQRHDHYGRWLGHVFLGDKNLNAEMLRHGMASVISIPPNLWSQDCYQKQEYRARQASAGLWGAHGIKIWQARELPKSLRGFHFVQGRVARIHKTRKSIWLDVSSRFSIRIARQDIPYFNQQTIYNLRHRVVEVRGWLTFYQGRLHMRIRQPAAMRIIH